MFYTLCTLYQAGDGFARLRLLTLMGWALAPVVALLRQYVFDDWQFLLTLCIVIGVDSLLGAWHAWHDKRLSSKGIGQALRKVAFYALLLIATHALATHKVRGEPNVLLAWIDGVVYGAVLVREFLSILEHSAALGIWRPPVQLLRRLQQFDDDGQPIRKEAPHA